MFQIVDPVGPAFCISLSLQQGLVEQVDLFAVVECVYGLAEFPGEFPGVKETLYDIGEVSGLLELVGPVLEAFQVALAVQQAVVTPTGADDVGAGPAVEFVVAFAEDQYLVARPGKYGVVARTAGDIEVVANHHREFNVVELDTPAAEFTPVNDHGFAEVCGGIALLPVNADSGGRIAAGFSRQG